MTFDYLIHFSIISMIFFLYNYFHDMKLTHHKAYKVYIWIQIYSPSLSLPFSLFIHKQDTYIYKHCEIQS